MIKLNLYLRCYHVFVSLFFLFFQQTLYLILGFLRTSKRSIMRASFLYIHIYSSLDEPMLQKLKTFAVHSACVRPFDYCFDWRIETGERERGRGRDKDGAANSFPTVYRDNFFGNFFDKYTSVCKKGSCNFQMEAPIRSQKFDTSPWQPVIPPTMRHRDI